MELYNAFKAIDQAAMVSKSFVKEKRARQEVWYAMITGCFKQHYVKKKVKGFDQA